MYITAVRVLLKLVKQNTGKPKHGNPLAQPACKHVKPLPNGQHPPDHRAGTI
jgi:hypothetical protein